MLNILIRADSSSTIGTGHIMRDLVLAKQFSEGKVFFATQDLDGNLNAKIIESGYGVKVLSSNDVDELIAVVKELNIDMVVVDHYEIDYMFEKSLKDKAGVKIMILDDMYEKHYCDILLNHNISASEHQYKGLVPKECELRCGANYTLLREEFYQEKARKREKIYDVFIAMGGADTQNLNIQLLELLPDYFKIAVVTTTVNQNLEALKAYVAGKEPIDLHINSTQIAQLMNESKFAIVTPSVTVNEVFFMELPFLAIKTAKNQGEMVGFLLQHDYLVVEGFQRDKVVALLSTILIMR